MATVADPPAQLHPKPARRRRLWLVLALVLALLWFLPTLVARTPLRDWILGRVLDKVPGAISVEELSLGWFSAIEARGITWRGPDGALIAEVGRFSSERTLIGFLFDRTKLGNFRCEGAALHLALSGQGSNLEQALAQFPPSADEPPSAAGAPPTLSLELPDAKIHLRDADAKRDWLLDPVRVAVALGAEGKAPVHVEVRTTIHDAATPGMLEASLSLHPQEQMRGECQATIEALPLELLAPLLRRTGANVALAGRAQGHIRANWDQASGALALRGEGELRGEGCTITGPLLSGNRLTLAKSALPFKVGFAGDKLTIDKADFACDVGSASVRGTFDLGGEPLTNLDRPGAAIAFDVDLVALAEKLPATLRLHQDTRLTSGRITLDCKSVAGTKGTNWQGKLQTTDLRGVRGGQAIAWNEPIVLTFDVRGVGRGIPIVDHLHCVSGFLRLDGAADADKIALRADLDLEKLAEPLGRFFDLGNVRLAGQADVQVTVNHRQAGAFDLDAGGSFRGFRVQVAKDRAFTEDSLTFRLKAEGTHDAGAPRDIQRGSLRILGGPDVLEADLLTPIDLADPSPRVAATVKLDGEAARWQRRATAFTDALKDWQLGGMIQAKSKVTASAAGVECSDLSFTGRNVLCLGPGLWLREPTLDLQAKQASYAVDKSSLEFKEAQLRSATVNMNTSTIQVAALDKGISAAGGASLSADLAGLSRWFTNPATPPATPLAGGLIGQVQMRSTPERLALIVNLTGTNIIVGPPASPALRESQMTAAGQVTIDWNKDECLIEQLRLQMQTLGLDASGRIGDFSKSKDIAVSGKLHYDLEKLEPMLRPYLGTSAKIAGKDSRPFTLRGPLAPPPGQSLALSLSGDAGAHWSSVKAYGCDVGPAEVHAKLEGGLLRLLPVEASLNGGRMRLQGDLRLAPDPQELLFSPGVVLDKAQITPQMCAGALAFAIPAFAGVSEAEGKVSVFLEHGKLPLADPKKGDIKGKLVLHSAKIGPGPLVRELSGLLRTPAPASLVKEAHVPFRLIDGRVQHRDLELMFPDFTVRTAGSVGLDGSLGLIAEMPIPPKWIGNSRLGTALAKRKLQIPVTGTIERPRLDEQALRNASLQFTRDAAADLLREEAENRLKKLFGPK